MEQLLYKEKHFSMLKSHWLSLKTKLDDLHTYSNKIDVTPVFFDWASFTISTSLSFGVTAIIESNIKYAYVATVLILIALILYFLKYKDKNNQENIIQLANTRSTIKTIKDSINIIDTNLVDSP